MADAGASRKPYAVAGFKLPQIAVYPGFRIPFQHIDELFFVAFRVGIGGSTPGRQTLVVTTDSPEPQVTSQRCTDGEKLVTVGIG